VRLILIYFVDLKAENILVYFDGGIKIADLDLNDDMISDHKLIINGNRMWMAPEVRIIRYTKGW